MSYISHSPLVHFGTIFYYVSFCIGVIRGSKAELLLYKIKRVSNTLPYYFYNWYCRNQLATIECYSLLSPSSSVFRNLKASEEGRVQTRDPCRARVFVQIMIYIVGFGLVQNAISTNPTSTIYIVIRIVQEL